MNFGKIYSTLKNGPLCFFREPVIKHLSSLMAQLVKHPSAMQETQEVWVQCLGWEYLLEEGIETHSSILPGEIHGLRSLAVYSPKDHKESDTTE